MIGVDVGDNASMQCRFKILERRNEVGGTWSLFQYPGIRSDSDMYTFGFSFRPWMDKKIISPGADIMKYLQDTVTAEQCVHCSGALYFDSYFQPLVVR